MAEHVSGTLFVFFATILSATSKMLPFSMIIFSLIGFFWYERHSAVVSSILTFFALHEGPVLYSQSPFLQRISIGQLL